MTIRQTEVHSMRMRAGQLPAVTVHVAGNLVMFDVRVVVHVGGGEVLGSIQSDYDITFALAEAGTSKSESLPSALQLVFLALCV